MSTPGTTFVMEIENEEFDPNEKLLSQEQRIWVIAQRLDCKSVKEIIETWPFERNCPAPKTVYRLIDKVKKTGSVEDILRSGRPNTEDTEENRKRIINYIEKYKYASVRDIATELDLNKTYVQQTLSISGYHAYKIAQVPLLKNTHKHQRLEFGKWYLGEKNQTTEVIWWSDECWFRLEARINSQNNRVWAKKQPYEIRDCPYRTKPLKFWAAINGKGEIVFEEVEETMTAETYIAMLKRLFPSMGLRWRLFQQDGASPHTAKITTQFLDKACKRGWIGLGSDLIEWPAHSADIAPCDYGLWPYLQARIVRRMAATREELRAYVLEEFQEIPKQVITNICRDMRRRCEILVASKGGNVEHPQMVEE